MKLWRMLYVRGEMNRLGFLKLVVLCTNRGAAVVTEALAAQVFAMAERKISHWKEDLCQRGASVTGFLTRGKAVSYVEWAQGLGFLVNPYNTWSRHAELLSLFITDPERIGLKTPKVLQPNPLILTQEQQCLMLKRLIDNDGYVLIPFLSRIHSLPHFRAPEVYPLIKESILEGIQLGLKAKRSDIYEADQMERTVSNYQADTLRQKALPRIEPLIDIGILRKEGKMYFPQIHEDGHNRLEALFSEFQNTSTLDSQLQNMFFRNISRIYDAPSEVPKEGYLRLQIAKAYSKLSRGSMHAVYIEQIADWIGVTSLWGKGILVEFEDVASELKTMAAEDDDISLATDGQGKTSLVTVFGDTVQKWREQN